MLHFSQDVRRDFPELKALTWKIKGVRVARESAELEKFKKTVIKRIKDKYTLNSLKDEEIFRRYRDFFWRLGIDPTKIRPASEALIRRVLQGKAIPRINTLVDAYNMASMVSGVALAAFDNDNIRGEIIMRRAAKGEKFRGIGMNRKKILRGGEIVLEASGELIAMYPYRDADNTKIAMETRNVLLVSCGVPGLTAEDLIKGGSLGTKYITRFCGGFSIPEK